MKNLLLLYGSNADLLQIRQMVLRSAGHEARGTTDPNELAQFMQIAPPDVLILCHSLLEAERVRILGLIPLLCPETKALVLLAGQRSSPEAHHANLETIEGPKRLLEVIEQLAAIPDVQMSSVTKPAG